MAHPTIGVLVLLALLVAPVIGLAVLVPRYRREGRSMRSVFQRPGSVASGLGTGMAAAIATAVTAHDSAVRATAIFVAIVLVVTSAVYGMLRKRAGGPP